MAWRERLRFQPVLLIDPVDSCAIGDGRFGQVSRQGSGYEEGLRSKIIRADSVPVSNGPAVMS